MKKIILISLLISLLLISGCSKIVNRSNPVYFDDTGNKISNMEECDKLLENQCNNNFNCIAYTITKLECDNGKCYCD